MTHATIESAVEAFVTAYRDAFERGDAAAIVGCFGESVQVVTDTGTGVHAEFVAHSAWHDIIQALLSHYQALGVGEITIRSVQTTGLSQRLALANVTWALLDRRGEALYEFHAVYTLDRGDTRCRIVAIAHDERAQSRQYLARTSMRTHDAADRD